MDKKTYSIKIDGIEQNIKNTESLGSNVAKTGNAWREAQKALKDVKAEMVGLDKNSKQWQDLAKVAGDYKDRLDDINQAARRFASDTKGLDDAINIGQSMTSVFTLAQGAMSAFGMSTDDVVKSIQKLQGAMAILQSLQTLQNTLRGSTATTDLLTKSMKLLGIGMEGASKGTKILRIGLASIGIGLIIGLVATLIEHWDSIKKAFKDTFPILGELSKRFNGFKGVIFGVGNAIKTALMMPFEKLGKAFMKLIKGDFSGAVKELTSGWSDAWQKIKDGFKSGVEESRAKVEDASRKASDSVIKNGKKTAKATVDEAKKGLVNYKTILNDLVKAEKKAQDDIQKYRDQKRKENEKKQKENEKKQQETDDALFNLKEAEYQRDLAVLKAMDKENEALELTAQWNDYLIKHNAAKELGVSVEQLNELLNTSNGLYKDLDEKSKAIVDKTRVQLETNSINRNSSSSGGKKEEKKKSALAEWFENEYTQEFMALGEDTFNVMADSISMMMDWAITEAEEKLNEVTELHDKAVGKVEESQTRIAELNDKMKDASGSRLEAYKQQIADEVLLQQQRETEEKRLAKDKEKREQELRKRQKDAAKAEVKMQIAQAIINTGMAVTKTFAQFGFPMGPIFGAIISTLGTIQVAMMAKQLSKMASGGVLGGREHKDGGNPVPSMGVEVEKGEAVINKRSTAKYLPLLDAINAEGNGGKHTLLQTRGNVIKRYADGGVLNYQRIDDNFNRLSEARAIERAINSIDFHPVVSVQEISRVQRNIVEVRELAGARD
jgi:hypothetical protein